MHAHQPQWNNLVINEYLFSATARNVAPNAMVSTGKKCCWKRATATIWEQSTHSWMNWIPVYQWMTTCIFFFVGISVSHFSKRALWARAMNERFFMSFTYHEFGVIRLLIKKCAFSSLLLHVSSPYNVAQTKIYGNIIQYTQCATELIACDDIIDVVCITKIWQ